MSTGFVSLLEQSSSDSNEGNSCEGAGNGCHCDSCYDCNVNECDGKQNG